MQDLHSKILVIKLRALGDTVLLTAPLLELTRQFPQATIHVLVPQPWSPLFENFPGVKKIWKWNHTKSKLKKIWKIICFGIQLRKEKFDIVINFHASPTSAILSYLTGAPKRAIHFHGHSDKNKFSTVQIPDQKITKPIIERDADTIRALGISIPQGLLPQIFIPNNEISKIKSWRVPQLPLLTMSLGASRSTKNWGVENFAQIVNKWVEEEKGQVIAFAGASEKNLVDQLNSLIIGTNKKNIYTSNDLSLNELASILKLSHVALGNDSGPKHLAVAVGTPTITLFGPEHPFEWHPYPQDKHPYFFIEDLKCRVSGLPEMPAWCGIPICIQEKHQCMKKIEVQDVFKTCKKIAHQSSLSRRPS